MAARSARNSARSYQRSKRRIIAKSRQDSARAAAKRKAHSYRGPGCTIDHRSWGASERCRYCIQGRDAKAAKKAAKLARAQSRISRLQESSASLQPSAKPVTRQKQIIDDAQWRFLLSSDGTSRALTGQRDYVRTRVLRSTGVRPSLKLLTIGQAKRILQVVGADAAPLWVPRRKSVAYNRVAVLGRWALLCILLISAFLTPVGVIFGTGIIIGVILAKVRRLRRQLYEDRLSSTRL